MANYVTISTVGAEPLRAAPALPKADRCGQKAVDRMIEHLRGRIAQVLPSCPDLIVLPECCDRYADHAKQERIDYYRARGDQVRGALSEIARQHACYIAYSAVREMPDGSWRNATQILDRNGAVAGVYNKNHVVIEETTQYGILCGKDAPIIATDFGRIGCAICFDLNFAELRRKYAAARPDLIVFSSVYHGGLMQAYWAYACRAHFVSAIAGEQSGMISPVGEQLAVSTNYFDFVTARVNLDCCVVHLDYNWGRLRAMREKYGPEVRVFDPGYLGSVLISSESEARSVDDLVAEFGIERLDDYMARALEHHHNPAHIED